MAIAVATLPNVPYQVGNPLPPMVHNAPPVFAYNWNTARVTTATGPGFSGTTLVTLTLNAGGDTIFLPYGQNEIHSVYLPMAALAAAGVTCFTTANLSGCRLYIDQVVGTNDLVIYHANSIAVGAGAAAPPNPMNMDHESVALAQALDALYMAARAYWTTPAPAGPGLNLTAVCSLGITTYNTCAVEEMQRKLDDGRTNVVFLGGTTVVGVLTPGGWQMHWQTYGDTTYTRPDLAPKGWVEGQNKVPTGGLNYRVLRSRQWYP